MNNENKKQQTTADKYLIQHEYEPNEYGVFIYASTSGNHKADISSVLEDFHYEQSKHSLEAIEDLQREVDMLQGQNRRLENKNKRLNEENERIQEELDDLRCITDRLIPKTMLDTKKQEILQRLYKFISLEELEAIEAPFKERVGYVDLIY